MSITLDLPPAALLRLEAEATRRGVSLDAVIAELAESLPAPAEPEGPAGTRFAFAGVAASGDGTLSERYKAIRRDEFGS